MCLEVFCGRRRRQCASCLQWYEQSSANQSAGACKCALNLTEAVLAYVIIISIQIQANLSLLRKFLSVSEAYYIDGKPMHANQQTSKTAINVTTKSALKEETAFFIRVLRAQHLLISHQRVESEFCIDTLLALRSYSTLIPITGTFLFCFALSISSILNLRIDHSVHINDPSRVKDGTISDLVFCAHDRKGKILSADSFPLVGSGWNKTPYSTDYVAWLATQGMPFAKDDIPLPVGEFTFGGAATAGAVFWWRFAPNGLGMSLRIKSGGLVMIIGRPKSPWIDNEPISYDSYDDFSPAGLLEDFSDTAPAHDDWITEAVYLDAASEL